MASIRTRGTAPELKLRSALRSVGLPFRVNHPGLPGRPDIVLMRPRVAVFVHGCFWHQHHACGRARVPRTNRAYWRRKFRDNRARDARKARRLRRHGWSVRVIWECSARDDARLARFASGLARLAARREPG